MNRDSIIKILENDDQLQKQEQQPQSGDNNPRANAILRLQNLRLKWKSQTDGHDYSMLRSSIHPPHHRDIEVNNTIMQFLFEKKLKHSDVKQEGRIIIPKAYAEKYLPKLESNLGHHMFMEDMVVDRIWMFRFSVFNVILYGSKYKNEGIGVRKYDANLMDDMMISPKDARKERKIKSSAKRKKNNNPDHINARDAVFSPSFAHRLLNVRAQTSSPSGCSEYSQGLQGFPFHLITNVKIIDLPEY
ncbi:OLC1v1035888C1 [Oldenlandia corymbosa var. corymbosa]|uniref:OLC1v1035888C1 n=1 Tax=Oldenlandia corymbosa var. corymbosa TaxID=529605 RepID=A0AAV1CXF9_OLDCO|nr:OLC1v1035888C1 [Oldenlandia corymbosa var. corymbosa]